jgi:SpoVK/Ycf46/Vps4 family AAA+-type ATPase
MCGKYKNFPHTKEPHKCEKCGVDITTKKVRRERMGHIELASPVSHIWFFKAIPSKMALVLDMSPKQLEQVLYFAENVVLDPGTTPLEKGAVLSERQYAESLELYGNEFRVGMGAEAIKELLQAIDVEALAEELKKELETYIGLGEVKNEVRSLINLATVYALRRKNDLPTPEMSLHLVFSGNPGTGKTMIARFMARVYHSLGLLSKGQLVEVDRASLVAGYVGQTAQKTAKVLESALGGVLFIDEAYSLTSKSENDYGMEAVETILKYMEDNRDDIIIIIAGYSDLMQDFIDSNPGLQSRFNKYIDFADYTAEEMLGIFKMNCEKSCYVLTAEAEASVKEYFEAVGESAGEFGNARGVRNSFEKILTEQANRIAELPSVTRDDLMKITKDDVTRALFEEESEKKAENE